MSFAKCLQIFVLSLTLTVISAREEYLNEWTVHIPKGPEAAQNFAQEHGFVILGEVIPDSNHFHMRYPKLRSKRSTEPSHHVTKSILESTIEDVFEVEQQTVKSRVKRNDIIYDLEFNDPYWSKMWYLNRGNDLDMNVEGAWRQGITGKGVAVTILDDGIEKDHPDLIRNYDPLASTDINDNDSDPQPRYDFSDSNRHGTRCAGQVAASPNNSLCSVGIAYNAQIGGIRMLDGQVSDAVEARSLSFNPDHVDIYSSSWGPNDDGKTVDGPGKMASRAFKNGITRGRDGKGSIFVWASGNGGRYKDNCNCDGYATSIYTITVSSTSESGHIPWYSEACSSTLATTYSSGTTSERQIVTTDLHHSCTVKHTGTSASAPMAAGIIALALEANPSLTWRDVQHLIVKTSQPRNLKATDWRTNGMKRKVSHSYGYGIMDTGAMVSLARNWTLVPEQKKCTISSPYYYKVVPPMSSVTIELEVDNDCHGINSLEHVVSPIHVSAGRKRGDLRIYLTSPQGTRSTLLDARPQDYSSSGYIDWPFMTTHSWGENPHGKWVLEIHNDAYSKYAAEAKFFKWSLELYGIQFDPNSQENNHVVREAPAHMMPQTTTSTTQAPRVRSTSTSSPINKQTTEYIPRGCVSKRSECTQKVEDCRTFTHRSVAQVFCRCSQICLEVASHPGTSGDFNMQCHASTSVSSGNDNSSSQRTRQNDARSLEAATDVPFYCQFIPFLNT